MNTELIKAVSTLSSTALVAALMGFALHGIVKNAHLRDTNSHELLRLCMEGLSGG